jgi:hypothetical protein
MNDLRQRSPSVARNRDAIAAILEQTLPRAGLVLEIASGSGEHVAFFAEKFRALRFQPSDADVTARLSISAWAAECGVSNVAPPLALDAGSDQWPIENADAVLCVNMIHISVWRATQGLFRGAARLLPARAPLYLYGPYKRGGVHTAPSNVEFDAWLKAKNPEYGVRDLEAVAELARDAGFGAPEIIDMPANNFSVIFRRA